MNSFEEPVLQISIAVCDDIEKESERIRNLLIRYELRQPQYNYITTTYSCMEDLLSAINQGEFYDILILDIYMKEISGVDGAKALRYNGFDGEIIFCTTSDLHAVDAFTLNAAQYLVKPINEKSFFNALNKAVSTFKQNKKNHILINVERDIVRIDVNRILYIESEGHHQNIIFVDGTTLSPRIKSSDFFPLLPQNDAWLKISKSYIVNLAFVKKVSAKEISLTNGEKLFLPRGSYKQVKEEYIKYYTKEGQLT